MTLVTLPSPIYWPGNAGALAGGPSLVTVATLDASGEYAAYVQVAREDMVISHVGFRAGTATNSPTVEVRIETLDSSGVPSGTLWDTNTNGTSGVITTNSNPLVALTASASISKGQAFAVKILWGGVATSSIIVQSINQNTPFLATVPYSVVNTTGSAVKSASGTGTIALGSSSSAFYYVPGHFPISGITISGTFNNTNGARRGLKFTPPMAARAVGFRWAGSSAVGDFDAVLYDVSDNVLSTTSFDGDVTGASNNGTAIIFFDTQVDLTAGDTYRIAIVPSSATNANLGLITLPSADYFTASPAGATAVYSTYASGSWTDSTTQLPLMDVILDQLDDGAGTGGGGVIGVIGG